MFAIDFESKEFKGFLRFAIYGVLGLLAAVITTLLVLAAQGYDINRATGEVIQNGLILVGSEPDPAEIFINGEPENDTTPGRLALPAGEYTVTLQRNGYRDWTRTVTLGGSQVVWLYYPRMFPQTINTNQAAAFVNLAFAEQSPDKRWLLMRSNVETPTFELFDINSDPLQSQTITLDKALFVEGDVPLGAMEFVAWASDSRHFLITHQRGDALDFLVIDREQPAESRNISREFSLPFGEMAFRDGDWQRLYGLTGGELRDVNLGDRTVSAPLLKDVLAFKAERDIIAYLQAADTNILAMMRRGDQDYLLRTLPADDVEALVDFTSFDGDRHVVIGSPAEGKLYAYKDPLADLERTGEAPLFRVLDLAPTYIAFSPNGRFIVGQNGSQFMVYDFDENREYAYALDRPVAEGFDVLWMDGHHMYVNSNGAAVVFDFDGSNINEVMPAHPGFEVFFDRSFERAYSIDTSNVTDRFLLEVSELVIRN